MFKLAKPFFIKVITPLHVGSGQDLGIVDLPIQREKHTGFPKIESSSLKGSIREAFEGLKTEDGKVNSEELEKAFCNLKEERKDDRLIKFDQTISLVFGPEEGDLHAGALGFTDARLLLFPVKSMRGIFAYITCPKVLKRFKEELELTRSNKSIGKIPEINVPSEGTISSLGELVINGNIVLEEYTFQVKESQDTKDFADWLSDLLGIEEIKNRFVVLSDDDFKDFVDLSTEVVTRTKIDPKTGTVFPGALFTEEYLPSETIMYFLALTTPIFNDNKGIFKKKGGENEEKLVMKFFEKGIPNIIQIGGNATIGKGIVEIKKWEEKK